MVVEATNDRTLDPTTPMEEESLLQREKRKRGTLEAAPLRRHRSKGPGGRAIPGSPCRLPPSYFREEEVAEVGAPEIGTSEDAPKEALEQAATMEAPDGSHHHGQTNLGRGTHAQDLWIHNLAEMSVGLGLVTEPHLIPAGNPNWLGSKCSLVAVVANPTTGAPLQSQEEGAHREGLGELARIVRVLDRVGDVVRQCHPRPVVVAGDFNAHSDEWGCSPWQWDPWSKTVADWASC
ncbi:uncharacterized protein LOC112588729 [Harpegnathos saltator]|uniref:uncharacterized protein LOC112588729 n=1 Tax=Harpegnathos saltator TaxID=610380 RepID=UPI000DBEE718|nr:uncharacterized protein LOC112588729 [Harpegnathos saltator]